jgi:hypothetical protein
MDVKNALFLPALVPAFLCVIPQAAQAGTISSSVTYVLTQDLPSMQGDSPTFTWTTGPINGYVTDGTAIPFLSGPAINGDASNDGYLVADTPDVIFQGGSFEEISLDYFLDDMLFVSTNQPDCAAGSDQSGCTFSVAVDYEGMIPDPPGFAPDPLNISGSADAPEPSSAVLALLGGFGLLAARRFRFVK